MNKHLFGTFQGLASGLLWGADTALTSVLLTMVPFVVAAPQMIPATLLVAFLHDLFSVGWLTGDRIVRGQCGSITKIFRSPNTKIVMLGAVFGGPIGMRAYLYAIESIGPGYTATISALYPALAAVLGFIIMKDRLSARGWVGLALSVAAIVWLSASGFDSTSNFPLIGLGAALICLSGWALESVIIAVGMKGDDLSSSDALYIRQVTSAVAYLIVLLFEGDLVYSISQVLVQPSVLLIIAIAGIGTLSYLCYYAAINAIGPVKATGLNVTYSVWAVVISLLLQGGAFEWKLIVCGVMIICGSVLIAKQQ